VVAQRVSVEEEVVVVGVTMMDPGAEDAEVSCREA
jgi:hypothetical protein